jgi:hypothetical protein
MQDFRRFKTPSYGEEKSYDIRGFNDGVAPGATENRLSRAREN